MTRHYNRKKEKAKRKTLRKNPTDAERKLWYYLRGKRIAEVKFRRQYSIDSYVLDFYAPKLKLAIEVDGDSHFTSEGVTFDQQRAKHIEAFGIKILRFTNGDVYNSIEDVLSEIERVIRER